MIFNLVNSDNAVTLSFPVERSKESVKQAREHHMARDQA